MDNYCVYCMNENIGEFCGCCGKKQSLYNPAPHHLQPNTVLNNKYVIGSVIGEGGFGITYIGKDINLNLKVAIKEYYPSGIVNRNTQTSTEITANVGNAQDIFDKGKVRFLDEARILAKFSDEPNVVTVRDFFSCNNTAYIVMDYLEGTDLKDYLAKQGKMSFLEAYNMLSPIMTVLTKIHDQNLIHRDISPTNIMILNNGDVKLLDFGAARDFSGMDDKSLSIMLKPGYAPEEQYRSKGHQGPWTDVYALTATLYKMVTGQTPEDSMNRIFSDELVRPSYLNPTVTPEQEAVIMHGMAVQYTNRIQSTIELQNECYRTLVNTPDPSVSATYQNNDNTVTALHTDTVTSQQYSQPVLKSVNPKKNTTDHKLSSKSEKKPNVVAFIASTIFGLLLLFSLFMICSTIIMDSDGVWSFVVMAVVEAVASVGLGFLYYPRFDNKSRKPNKAALVLNIFTIVNMVLEIMFCFYCYGPGNAEYPEIVVVFVFLTAVIVIFTGYFYYPRLDKKRLKTCKKVFSISGIAVVLALVFYVVILSLNTVTIGSKNFSRSTDVVTVNLDTLTDNDIDKLKNFSNLKKLELVGCFLDDDDIKTISQLTQLESLSVSFNTDITDVSPLSNMTNLEKLNIKNTNVSDIGKLSTLTKLKELEISDTKITNIDVVKNFTELTDIYMNNLDGLKTTDISMPKSVTNVHCQNCNISDIDFLLTADSLSILYLSGNNICDISGLGKYEIYYLVINSNKIKDISAVAANCEELEARDNFISDISAFSNFNGLKLCLDNNDISSISALADNDRIRKLTLSGNGITDISALENCYNIRHLDLSDNRISDISALARVDELDYLDLRNNEIKDISPLAENKSYPDTKYTVYLSNNKISDITPLKSFKNCDTFYLRNNDISDISALASCSSANTIYADFNNINDIAVLSGLNNLRILSVVGNPVDSLSGFSMPAYDSNSKIKNVLSISYSDKIDWIPADEFNKNINVTSLFIYDIPGRQKNDMDDLGYFNIGLSSDNYKQEINQEEASTQSTESAEEN